MTKPVEVSGPASECAPEAVRPPPGNPRFPLVDGLRALAALGVVASHVSFASGLAGFGVFVAAFANLDVGVTLFFAISGFLLYRPFIVSDFSGSPISTIVYARRRALRILPAYWVALTALAIYPGLEGVFTNEWWRYYFLVQNYSPDPEIRLGGLVQAWSLNVEVAFYLILPFYALIARRFLGGNSPNKRVTRDLLVLCVLSLGSILLHTSLAQSDDQEWLRTLPSYFAWFAVGMGLALISVIAPMVSAVGKVTGCVSRRSREAAGIAFVVYLLLSIATTLDSAGFRSNNLLTTVGFFLGSALIAALIMTIAVFPVASDEESFIQRWIGGTSFSWLGLISYGIFLWNLGVVIILIVSSPIPTADSPWLRFVLYGVFTLAFTVPIAALSYYFVERPFLRLKEGRRFIR